MRYSRIARVTLIVAFAMTLALLHSRFLRVFVVPLGLDVDLCVGTFELVYF